MKWGSLMNNTHPPLNRKVPAGLVQDLGPTGSDRPVTDIEQMSAIENLRTGAVPEERGITTQLSAIAERWGSIITLCILIAGAVWGYSKTQYDLDNINEDLKESTETLKNNLRAVVKIDKTLILAEKDIEFLDKRVTQSESEIIKIKASTNSLERQQAIISDRETRSHQEDQAK